MTDTAAPPPTAVVDALLEGAARGAWDDLSFRRLGAGEFGWLRTLHRQAMHAHVERAVGWDDEVQRARLVRDFAPDRTAVVLLGGRTVGCVKIAADAAGAEICQFYLADGWRGLGVGTRTLGAVLAAADRLELPARLSVLNGSPARSLYERHGFRTVRRDQWREFMERPGPARRAP